MKRWPFLVALALMGGTWMLLASRSQAEPEIARRPFTELPIRLGDWSGRDRELDKEVLELLKLTDYVMRVYVPGSQQPARSAFEGQTRQAAAPVALYVGYYASQRSGATYHSPKNCLPGGGSSVLLEITFRPHSYLETLPPEQIKQRVVEDLQRLNFIHKTDVQAVELKTFQYAYVIYDLEHRRNTDTILNYLARIGIRCAGRFAEFEYLNSDGVAAHTRELAVRALGGANTPWPWPMPRPRPRPFP